MRRQTVPIAVHGVDEPGIVGIGLDFLPESGDRVVNGPCVRRVRIAPDFAQQLVSLYDRLLTDGEVLEELELAVREVDLGRPSRRVLRAKIDDDVTECQLFDR